MISKKVFDAIVKLDPANAFDLVVESNSTSVAIGAVRQEMARLRKEYTEEISRLQKQILGMQNECRHLSQSWRDDPSEVNGGSKFLCDVCDKEL